MVRTLIWAAVVCLIFAVPQVPADQVQEFERRAFELTNTERAQHGLPPFIWHDVLASIAREHSEDMLRNNMTGHTGSDGSSPKDRADRKGIKNASQWSENVAYGSSTPEAVVQGWMNSPGHRANILSDKSTHIGVGLVLRPAGSGAAYSHYWTQAFIRSTAAAEGRAQVAVVQSTAAPVQPPLTAQAAPASALPEAAGAFTVIPNPVVRPGGVTLYWQGKRLQNDALSVYDASTNNLVAGIDIADRGAVGDARRRVGVWNLRDSNGRPVQAGRYTVRGALKTHGGESARVELTVDVR